ncbi:hypothetical protein BHE74_00019608 [Ensete ventricosum]|nr:hypothetical protein BHE74_00019608 [Ensete ventricosum]
MHRRCHPLRAPQPLQSLPTGGPVSPILVIEFDVFQNEEFHDINDNHIGVDRNFLTSVSSVAAGYWRDDDTAGAAFVGLTLNDGSNYQAWVDYDYGRFNFTMAPAVLSWKLRRPLISIEMDLSDVFLNEMYIGFCAATRKLVERHHIHAWSFSNLNFYADDNLIVASTENFSKRNLIDRGGNGSDYKGVLDVSLIAVKLFSQTNEEEAKQFVVEVCTLGRLKHRYLVGLRGWCRFR